MNHFKRLLNLAILLALAACSPAVSTDTHPTTNPAITEPSGTIATLEPTSPPVPSDTPIPSATTQPSPTLPLPTDTTNWLYQIAFASSTSSNYGRCCAIKVINADGTGLINITGQRGEFAAPAWSPDGLSLAVRRDDPGGISLIRSTTTNGLVSLDSIQSLVSGFSDAPAWTPDGLSITFQMADNYDWYLYNVPAEGGRYTRLANLPAEVLSPAWSPDGTRLAYILQTNNPYRLRLYVANADGTNQTLLSTGGLDADHPDWSPDGKQIAFAGFQSGARNLYIINADGSDLRQVTHSGHALDPDWSPDGYRLAFTSDRDDNYDIYIINLDGTGELRLTSDEAFQRWPDWRRIPMPAEQPWLDCQSQATYLGDVSIPDGTAFSGGQEFQKIWRLQNTGTCAWTANYQLQYFDGERMGEQEQLALPAVIQPGSTFDLALPLTAPATQADYQGRWRITDAQDTYVPGPSGNPLTLTVDIAVQPGNAIPLPAPLYFLSERSGSDQVWRLERDGHTLTQITHTPAQVDVYAIAPATGTLAYSAGGQLFVADGLIASTDPDYSFRYLAWSADGRILAYHLGGIHLYDPQTEEDRLLIADNPAQDYVSFRSYWPVSFSPDGSQLAAIVGMWEASGWAIVDTRTGSAYEAAAPYSQMTTWSQSGMAFYIASDEAQEMMGFWPGLWRIAPGMSDLYTEYLIDNQAVWAPYAHGDILLYFLSGSQGLGLYRSGADGVSGRVALWQFPYLFGQEEIDSFAWTLDGGYVALSLPHRPTSVLNEVLLFSTQDAPPIYLLQDAKALQWGP
jgi:Tol biopolymer transport system component